MFDTQTAELGDFCNGVIEICCDNRIDDRPFLIQQVSIAVVENKLHCFQPDSLRLKVLLFVKQRGEQEFGVRLIVPLLPFTQFFDCIL